MSSVKPFLRGAGLLVLWGGINRHTTNEDELNDWWTNEHLPERLAIPGFLHARRYYAPGDSNSSTTSRYLTWYEVASLDTLTSSAYMAALNTPTPGTKRFMPTLASMNRSACTILHSVSRAEFAETKGGGVGAAMAHVALTPPSDPQARSSLQSYVIDTMCPGVLRNAVTLAFHLVQRDETATKSGSSTKSYDAVPFQGSSDPRAAAEGQWIILMEFAEPSSVPFAKNGQIVKGLAEWLGERGAKDVVLQVYELVCAVSE